MDSTEEMLVARSEVEEWEKSCGVAEEVALETGLRRGFREGRSPLEGNFGRIRWTRGRPFADGGREFEEEDDIVWRVGGG